MMNARSARLPLIVAPRSSATRMRSMTWLSAATAGANWCCTNGRAAIRPRSAFPRVLRPSRYVRLIER